MKIIELKTSNIKRLKAVEFKIDEEQNLIMITGKNAQGKSSVLDSIWYALGGKKATQDKPIREGSENAEVELTLKSPKGSYIVKRTFTETNSYLTLTNAEGIKASNPQEVLDNIVGNLSFDPLEFSRMDTKKQINELVKVVGLDFSELESSKKQLLEDRLLVGREQKNLPKISDGDKSFAEKYKDKAEISISELTNKLEKENAISSEFKVAKVKISNNNKLIADKKIEIENLQREIDKLKVIKDTTEDLDELRNKIAEADNINKDIRKSKDILNNITKLGGIKNRYEELTKEIKDLDAEKADKLAKAKMPIEGLSWDEDRVLYNGIPYNQISSAEQLRVSMAIAMAANPKLRMLQIRDGSLLDKENLKVIKEMIKEEDFQAFVEKVDESGKVGIVIEDGLIKKINN